MEYELHPAREIEHRARTIHPGIRVVDATRPLATLLGSFVAFGLVDPLARIGGSNHLILPSMQRSAGAEPFGSMP